MKAPFIIIIFGATGDLAKNKLIPALFSLFKQHKLPKEFFVIGFSRREILEKEFRTFFTDYALDSAWSEFSKHLTYQQGDFGQDKGYDALIKRIKEIDDTLGACITRFFYLATPPDNYGTILDNIVGTGLDESCGEESDKLTKIVIEKPFGKDLETAIALDKKLSQIFKEEQIFRVDHYLGKETVQNILAFRFANGIFEPVWNKDYIDHVQITWAEKKGMEGRGNFFDGLGILRDAGQNHLMQLLAAVAMEQPLSFARESLRDARANAIKAINCIEPEEVLRKVVRGQYQGYRSEKNVAKNSDTETFVAFKFFINTPRLQYVPFYVRAGKKMPKNEVTISLVFRQTCHILFKEYGCPEIGNVLTIRIQPDEGIYLRVIAKKPGSKLALETVNMHFTYEESFKTKGLEAYEKILLDIFAGDQMLFNRSDELASSWEFITKILEGWKRDKSGVRSYKSGTWGPKEANDLIERDGRKWL